MTEPVHSHVDLAQLRVGSYIRYMYEGPEHFGIVSEIYDKRIVKGTEKWARVQLWWKSAAGKSLLVREEDIPIKLREELKEGDDVSCICELLGQVELPVVVKEKKDVDMAPERPEGYKVCDVSKCSKSVFRVIKTRAVHRSVSGFKFGSIAPGEVSLIALCNKHYGKGKDKKDQDGEDNEDKSKSIPNRFKYGLLLESWTSYPKPKETQPPFNSEAPEAIVETKAAPKVQKLRKDGKVDGRTLRWQKMSEKQRQELVEKIQEGRKTGGKPPKPAKPYNRRAAAKARWDALTPKQQAERITKMRTARKKI